MKKDIDLVEFVKNFKTEEQCRDFLFRLRWSNGFVCPKCNYDKFSYITTRRLYHCLRCNHQASVIAKTVFHRSHLPLTKWFVAIFMLSHEKKGITAARLAREISVSQPTAWLMLHKLKKAMADKDLDCMISKISTATPGSVAKSE